jgi:Flp pilus assembly pilin Flp
MFQTDNTQGTSVVEFAFMLVLCALVVMIGLSVLGISISDTFGAIISALPFT